MTHRGKRILMLMIWMGCAAAAHCQTRGSAVPFRRDSVRAMQRVKPVYPDPARLSAGHFQARSGAHSGPGFVPVRYFIDLAARQDESGQAFGSPERYLRQAKESYLQASASLAEAMSASGEGEE